ncbi:MAG: putative peptidase [Prokaryotic dsDNA virus sp.]|mgnify:CR=1 FL=1|nr:MAG: putative peptidase [Prokaryotic dsDNA virus sp.]|tara:strand:+ start:4409 stop:5032 length:624 start_codon:yes stop_codon:yes gene_type:complete
MAKKKKKKYKKPFKITELVISDENEELAIDAISLVTDPAIEVDFVYFNKEKSNLTLAKIDEEKRMLVSPALIPNKNIYRYNADTDENYYVYFSKETVRKASEMYLKHNNHHKATYQHEQRVGGVLTVESWIKEDMKYDKSLAYGFDLPLGTWFVKMKIQNEEMWQKIKSGELKGLSIEGYFVNAMQKMGKIRDEDLLNALAQILKIK